MTRLSLASALLLLGLAAPVGSALAQEAAVYRWVDGQGVPHFSDQPPADHDAQEMTVHYRRTDKAAMQAQTKAKAELAAAGATREGLESEANAAAEADRQKVLAERQTNCKAAKDRVTQYNNALRLYRPGPNGERVYLTNEELDVERANANQAVEQWCSGQ
ncbi:MAG: DUF4124 domain-containing protein [Gammaproteobacteria bacterium PRO9]|nr:DUF4124 domain-containing protein [Gammaproteobacteria bacterium PRO9]